MLVGGLALTSFSALPVSAAADAAPTFEETFVRNESFTLTNTGTTPSPSLLNVSGLVGDVYDVDVTVNGIDHPRPSDLDVVVVAPGGASATIMSDIGGDQPLSALTTLTFDDDATAFAPPELTEGRYLPQDNDSDATDLDRVNSTTTLRDLTSGGVNGQWKLFIDDDSPGFDGAVLRWSLTFHFADLVTINGLPPDAVSSRSSFPLTGTGTPKHEIFVRLDGQASRPVIVADDGTWGTVFTDLAEGTHVATAANNSSGFTNYPVSLRLDMTAPAGSVVVRTSTGTPEVTSSRHVSVAVTASEALRGFRIRSASGAYGPLVSAGAPALWLLADTSGAQTVDVQLEDLAGNVSVTPILDTVTLDSVAPIVVTTSPAAGAIHVRRDRVVTARLGERATPTVAVPVRFLAQIFRTGLPRAIPAAVRWDATTSTVVITPKARMRARTRYKVVIQGFYDGAGNVLDQDPARAGVQPKVWYFRTR